MEAAAPVDAAEAPKAEEKKEEVAESKPPVTKRQSLFSNLSFGKKKVASPEPTPVAEAAPATEAVAETAPVIPAVETTEPLSTDVSSPATVPTETVEVAPATNGETKKEVKSDKRKSSLPFIGALLSPKEKTTSDDETEKPKSPSPFSKLRDTIKGKKAVKADKEEKTEETVAPVAEEEAAKPAEEVAAPVEVEASAPVATEEAPKTTPAVPVVSAAA